MIYMPLSEYFLFKSKRKLSDHKKIQKTMLNKSVIPRIDKLKPERKQASCGQDAESSMPISLWMNDRDFRAFAMTLRRQSTAQERHGFA